MIFMLLITCPVSSALIFLGEIRHKMYEFVSGDECEKQGSNPPGGARQLWSTESGGLLWRSTVEHITVIWVNNS